MTDEEACDPVYDLCVDLIAKGVSPRGVVAALITNLAAFIATPYKDPVEQRLAQVIRTLRAAVANMVTEIAARDN